MSSASGAVRRARDGLLALLAVQLLFGLFPLFVHVTTHPAGAGTAAGGLGSRAIAVWRILAGALVLGGVALVRHGRAFLVARGDLPRLLACSLLGITANMTLALEGTARTSVLHAGLLLTLIPVFTYAVAVLARVEPHRPRALAGIGFALAGAAWLMFLRGASPGTTSDTTGDALILANSLCYAGYLVLARTLLARLPTLVVIAWAFLLALSSLPLVARGTDLLPADVAPQALFGLAYLVLCATIAAYLLNTYALARVRASTVAAFIYLQPLVAGTSGVLLLGERPGAGGLGAALCLLSGLGLVTFGRESRASGARPDQSGSTTSST
jgi:drug/metabolite transporter (DMT)-like permease